VYGFRSFVFPPAAAGILAPLIIAAIVLFSLELARTTLKSVSKGGVRLQ
jgi:hypothetical protein